MDADTMEAAKDEEPKAPAAEAEAEAASAPPEENPAPARTSTRGKRSRELQALALGDNSAASLTASQSAAAALAPGGAATGATNDHHPSRSGGGGGASKRPRYPAVQVALAAMDDRKRERWKAHKLADDYVEVASNVALQSLGQFGPYGFDPDRGSYPVEAISVLQFLKSPMRRTSVLERWSPLEVALFEAALAEHGKEFHKVQKEIQSKTTREIVDFYYVWKKTPHYKLWKKQYVPPFLDASDDEDNPLKKNGGGNNGTNSRGKNGDRKPPPR